MPPTKKRKSEASPLTEETSSPKRVITGEKRKRGRPRKYPEGTGPKPPPGPKRGRGRPPKDPSAKDTPSKLRTPQEGKRPVGRPRKSLPQNGAETPKKPKSASADTKAEDGESSGRSYWLMKAEPETRFEKGVDVKFSIDDLRERSKPEPWDGVRNAAARNHLREMKKGELAFFYHSNCKVPGVAGTMEIVQEHTPDESAFDPTHPYYDEKSTRDDPKWDVVHVEFRRKFKDLVPLNDLKSHAKPGGALENLQMLKQSRLSVSRVSKKEWDFILKLAKGENESQQATEDSSKDDGSAEEDSS
ncbi:hypothetical protein EYZ11_000794 [Aspergillus tanneri]|uniref:Thymocyte nuclear protein 1 n=1 Tax=Aspergillus tanneri TaxID=1220188 RepID=A0A4S3JW91_9EURO|nr:hypothetical protein EYZ11_000794 [Aspergillus tanneri]